MTAQWRARFRKKKRTLRRFEPQTIAEVKKLQASGRSLSEISAATGISVGYANDIACGRARKADAGPDPVDWGPTIDAFGLYVEALTLERAGDLAGAAELAGKIVEMFPGWGKPARSPVT